ncbi:MULTISPECIES: carbohydrate ABC transporter permease [unclassified Paenibacillus]|uniref:carbohydrate ABC transporter permease n=1 Tax=unclassified Paenibacillus TaxID=185978 RepID=UPI001C118F28|nr:MULTISPECIES: carbohydrate ABC transporter permease [unclassified Paenibacillus]MBU5445222.1 carbohydrate ABC transporter permease [Paenibacillus sp. MSJ-34]CAH0121567.1 Melibiose/raffinose/stachyose import permease protein MelC [Paenibacillus sp. CECT 9249]
MPQNKWKLSNVIISLLTYALALLFLFPFLISLLMAMKTPAETTDSLLKIPSHIAWSNFSSAWEITHFTRSFFNSAISTVSGVLCIVICASMAAFAISRNSRKPLYKFAELLILAALMVPFQVIIIPVYKILKSLDMINTLYGYIIMLVGTSIPYSTFLYIGFIKSVPRELEEASVIDGCGPFRMFWQIVFPLLRPITATVAILHVMWLWNEFSIALIVLQKTAVRSIPMMQYFFFGQYTTNLNLAFASAVLTMIPIIVFFLFAQKQIIGGLTNGAVKG